MKPDKIEIVAVKNACTITAFAAGVAISEHVLEYVGGDTYTAHDPGFRESLPLDLALTLEDLQLNLMDAMLSLNAQSVAA